MLAHSTLARLATAQTSTRDLPQLARFLHRTLVARNASTLPAARALTRALSSAIEARRSYATTTAATTPTATVKKAVKAKAAGKAAPKKTAATKTAKKPARKTVAAKAKPKAKPKAKKKAAPKKAAPKKRVKKELTPEQKDKAKITRLRALALKEPAGRRAVNAYNEYIAQNLKGVKEATSALTDLAKKFKDLTPSEREHYNHAANERTAARHADYNAWIRSHTPEQIRIANNARAQLRRILAKPGRSAAHTAKLVDDRHVKSLPTPYVLFFTERHASGDMKGISVPDAAKVASKEWKALSPDEKKKYEDAYAASKRTLATAS